MNVLSINTSVVCERCCKGWKTTWALQKREVSEMTVFWVKRFGGLSLYGRIDHTWSVGWSMQIVMDQCQWSRFKCKKNYVSFNYVYNKYRTVFFIKKGKGSSWVLQHCCLEAYCTLTRMSSFIHLQRHCTHQAAWETSANEGRNYTWNLASNP